MTGAGVGTVVDALAGIVAGVAAAGISRDLEASLVLATISFPTISFSVGMWLESGVIFCMDTEETCSNTLSSILCFSNRK